MEEMTLKKYEKLKKEIALEIAEIFKSKKISVAVIDDALEYTKQHIHRNSYL